MMKKLMILGIVLCLLMTAGCGAGSSGPDEGALPPLETAPPATGGSQNYDRSDPIVIYQENLNKGKLKVDRDGLLIIQKGSQGKSFVKTELTVSVYPEE